MTTTTPSPWDTAEKPAVEFATPPPETTVLKKDALVGAVAVIHLHEFDPEVSTNYGLSPRAKFDLVVVTGQHAGYVESERLEFGAIARAIGRLEPQQKAVGRYVSGTTNGGKGWISVDWVRDDANLFELASEAWLEATKPGGPLAPPF